MQKLTVTPNFVKRDIVTGGYDVMLDGREIGYVTKGLAITLSGSALVTRWTARATDAHGQYREIGTWPTRQAAAAALVEAAAAADANPGVAVPVEFSVYSQRFFDTGHVAEDEAGLVWPLGRAASAMRDELEAREAALRA